LLINLSLTTCAAFFRAPSTFASSPRSQKKATLPSAPVHIRTGASTAIASSISTTAGSGA
jgi:hypothetical protein